MKRPSSKRSSSPVRAKPGRPAQGNTSPPRPPRTPRTVALVSLGCPKNLVDSEKMLGLLAESGLTPIADEAAADALIVNTCGFLEASKDESMGEIRRAAERKLAGSRQRLIVAGCLVQRHRAKMLEWCPQIDALIGVFDRDRIVEAVLGPPPSPPPEVDPGTSGKGEEGTGDHPVYSSIAANATVAKRERGLTDKGYFESDAARLRLTPRHYAYLRISEGCNQNCAFCTIPSIRGKMRSKPVAAILGEARELLMDGAFELNLIGQDTTSFGQDIGYGPGLVGMLEELDKCVSQSAGGGWIRLMYAYPSCFTDAMIDAIGRLPRVVKYIDMPLQHISDPVLTAMRRHTGRRLIEKLLDKLRTRIGGMALRTTFISGFPGETRAQHEELVAFVKDFGFDAMGVFAYSPEPGTPAGTMHDQGKAVPPEVVRQRVEELMLAQQAVAFGRNEAMAASGKELDVLIDGSAPATSSAGVQGRQTSGVGWGGKLYVGRAASQAPQIDGVTYVQSREKLAPGELVRCRLTDAAGYDLVAQPADEARVKVKLPVMR